MSLPDKFDPKQPVTADTVGDLTFPQLMERFAEVKKDGERLLEQSETVSRLPSLRGVTKNLEMAKPYVDELKVLSGAIFSRLETANQEIQKLKTEII